MRRRRSGVPNSHRNSDSGATPYKTNVSIPAVIFGSVAAISSVTYTQAIAMTYMARLCHGIPGLP